MKDTLENIDAQNILKHLLPVDFTSAGVFDHASLGYADPSST